MESNKNVLDIYTNWLEKVTDQELLNTLKSMNDEEVFECFYKELEFGTGGIRGIIGAGTNRMNIYTVGRSTKGLANMLLSKGTEKEKLSVAIGYDSRHKSCEFAQISAQIFATAGIKAYIYPTLMPTPCVSFAVRHLKCTAGIMITASHNPGKYNGYKVFGSDGCQMNLEDSHLVMNEIEKADYFNSCDCISFQDGLENNKIEYIDTDVNHAFIKEVLSRQVNEGLIEESNLKITYTPLNGAGNIPVRVALSLAGVDNIAIVKEQEMPNGDFPTCPFPNPEIKEALLKGLEVCKKEDSDLLLATDPDCDRVGIAVKQGDDYVLMTGNEVGVLLTDYLLKCRKEQGTLPQNPVVVKTIVTTPLVFPVAQNYGAQVIDVLTGFKFIGEQIRLLEQNEEQDRFIIGFEESYGYLSGTYVRDKDAVVASVLICEMAAFYKKQGKTLVDAMNDIYAKHDYYKSSQDNLYFEGAKGMVKMSEIMDSLSQNPPKEIAQLKVVAFADYSKSIKKDFVTNEEIKINLPKSNVVIFTLENNCEIIVRPSGTEPKIKIYYTSVAKTNEQADLMGKMLASSMQEIMK